MVSLNARSVLLVVLVGLGLAIVPGLFHPAHASSVGLVCLADPGSAPSPPANPCPNAPGPIFNGPVTSPGQQIRIGVFVNGSLGMNGFDITLLADHTVLKAAGVDLTGTVVPGGVILAECLSGVLVSGSACSGTDTSDTLHIAVISFGPNTLAPTTGLLFTAVYNITGTTSTSGIPIGFQTGCYLTSVSPSVCVTIASGSPMPNLETAQGATFDNAAPPPYLTVSSNSSQVGPMLVRSVAGLRLNLTGQNNWNLLGCPCPVTLSTLANSSLTVRLNATSLSVPSTGSVFAALNVTSTIAGNFSVSVIAQYSTTDLSNFNSSTLMAHVTVQVIVTDFALSANPLIISPVLVGVAASSLVTVTSVNGFAGNVGLVVNTSATALSCGLNPTSVTGSGTSLLSCIGSAPGSYNANVTGTNGSLGHSVTVNFIVPSPDFTVSASPATVTLLAGVAATSTINVASLFGFRGSVALTEAVGGGAGLSCSLGLSNLKIVVGASNTTLLSCTGSLGRYMVTVTGSNGTLTHSTSVSIIVQDFAISLSSALVSTTVGSNQSITLSVSGLNGFNQLVTLSITPPAGLTIVPMTSIFSAPGTIKLSFSGDTVGVYNVTVTVSSSSLSRSAIVEVKVSSSPTLFGLAPALFYSLLAALGAIAVVVVFLGLRRRKALAGPPPAAKAASSKKKR